jgi:methylenetetrahydrofolate reductase (NADPH)
MLNAVRNPRPPEVSFEFFPPREPAGAELLQATALRLAPLAPDFVSVTCGADGSTVSRTPECVAQLVYETGLVVAPHLTCVAADRAALLAQAADYWRAGRRRLVVLRGDRPADAARDSAGGFAHASDLVGALQRVAPFDIAVAAYPEGHPDSGSVAADIDNLARKVAAGARRAITQFCFDTDAILRYREQCRIAGIAVPVIPGILPIQDFAQVCRFAARCGATIPHWLQRRFAGAGEDAGARRRLAAEVLVEQVLALREAGFDAFHFYTLNRAELTFEACLALGLGADSAVPA